MRKLSLMLIPLLVITMLIGTIGCGGEDEGDNTPEPTATITGAATAEPTATEEPEATAIPADTPTATAKPTITTSMSALPCRFHGEVMLDGASVDDGIVITAIIDGDEYTTETPARAGPSTYYLSIEPDEGASYAAGTTVTFKIGNRAASETHGWELGGNVDLDLSAS